MALLFAGANSQYTFVASDRFLESMAGARADPAQARPFVIRCDDARAAVGFVSFAQPGQLDVRAWLRGEIANAARHEREQGPEFKRFLCGKISDSRAMPKRFYDERTDAEWSDAVFHHPMFGLEDSPTGELYIPAGQIAPKATGCTTHFAAA